MQRAGIDNSNCMYHAGGGRRAAGASSIHIFVLYDSVQEDPESRNLVYVYLEWNCDFSEPPISSLVVDLQ